VLNDLAVGLVGVDRLELEVSELGTDPGIAAAERFQRRRTRLRGLAVRIAQPALDERVAQIKKQLAGLGVTQLSARLNDGYVSVRGRAADGLAVADLSFQIHLMSSGVQLRALASAVRVHGHLPTPGPVIADRVLVALLGAGETTGTAERPHTRGLCDVEVDLVAALLWYVLPPNGWRLPAVTEIELTHIRVARAAIEIAYGPVGTRGGELGVHQHTHQLAAAHDLMHSVDQQLRGGHFEEAMRGYRALLASSGPDQPLLLERILALAAARTAWFFDGLELARQALGRWPKFAPAHAALASITLAQGDAREAAKHLEEVARMASAEGDDDQSALAALAAARLLRVLDAKAATQLYQLALEHDPGSAEAADSLADRLADEHRWPELVRLVRARVGTTDPARTVQLHLRLADVLVHQLGDPAGAQHELAAARALAPDDPAVHEMAATSLVASDPAAAIAAWREVARLAETRGDHRTCARAWAGLGGLLAEQAGAQDTTDLHGTSAAEDAWRRSLELDPLQADALVGLAGAAAGRNDHAVAADLYERLRGLGVAQAIAARHELALARSLVALGRIDDARASLRRATLASGETAAEAHAMLAEIADAALDRQHAAAELEIAISALIELASDDHADGGRLSRRAAELAVARAMLFDKAGQSAAAGADWQRAYALAQDTAPEVARDAARTLLARSGDDLGVQRRWIDGVLATQPPPVERAALLVRRADVRCRNAQSAIAEGGAPDGRAGGAGVLPRAIDERSAIPGGGDPDGRAGGAGVLPREINERRAGAGGGVPASPELAAALADLQEAIALAEAAGGAGITTRRRAHHLAAELFAQTGDLRSRAQALAALATLAERAVDRVETEAAAAAAWLATDDPAAALPHGARAYAHLAALPDGTAIPAALRREVLATLGEAAWRQRAWPDVIRAYRDLLEDPGPQAPRLATFRYRLAVAADRAGEQPIALAALRPLIDDPEATREASPELRAQALRLFADLAERAGDLLAAATGLESFAAIGGDSSATARADAVYRAGELFRRAERGDDAIRCLETALRISDAHMPALDALEAAWRERRDLERVAVIIGRKVAATARHPARQKPLLSRLGDLQDQLGRPDVARATHQRALEIDPIWRPSLRYITLGLRDSGQVVAAAGGLAQLAGELHGDHGVDLAIVTRERQIAAEALAELVAKLDDAQVDAVRAVARPALERAALDNADVGAGLARLRGEVAAAPHVTEHSEADTPSGRVAMAAGGALSLRDAAARSRADGKLDEALATLETANHVNPGDASVLRELVELATQLHDHPAAARHLTALALRLSGARRGDALLELADIYYDKLDDAARGRDAMRRAADAFGSGSRRDATLRMLASEAGTHLAWDIAVEAILSIPLEKRTQADFVSLATALMRAGRDADAVASIEAATAAKRFDDGGELEHQLLREIQRKTELARSLEDRAASAPPEEAAALRDEAQQLRIAIGQPGTQPLRDTAAPASETPKSDTAPWPLRTKTKPGIPSKRVTPAPVGSRTRATQPPPVGGAPPDASPAATTAPGGEVDVSAPEAASAGEPSSGVPTAALDVPSSAALATPDGIVETPSSAALDASNGAATDPAAERDRRLLSIAELTAAPDRGLASTAPGDRALASTDERDRGLASTAAPDRELAASTEPDRELAASTEPDRELAASTEPDRELAASSEPSAERADTVASAAGRATDRDRRLVSIAELTADRDRDIASSSEPAAVGSRALLADDGRAIATPAERGAIPTAVAHSTSVQMSAADLPSEPHPPEPRPRTTFSQPTLGRIKLVPRAVTRPGLGALRPDDPGAPEPEPREPSPTEDSSGNWQSVSNPALKSGPARLRTTPEPEARGAAPAPAGPTAAAQPEIATPSVTITGTPDETELALLLAAASADRDRLFAARRAEPDDPSVLLAVLAHLSDREPVLRRELLDEAVQTSHGRALAIALHELAMLSREGRDPSRATALWTRAYQTDPTFPPVWMPLADALAAADDTETARELYEAVARSGAYDITRRAFAADRADVLGRDDSIISGEIKPRVATDVEEAKLLAESEDWPGAIDAAERAATARPNDTAILEMLEKIYFASGNVTAASEAIGRQLMLVEEPAQRAALWRRRARMYRDTLGRDAEAYRCLKEAHACAPADPEIAYQLRTAAMVRGEWPLAASLLYREIAASANPRDRGALHLELALIYEERLDDYVQAQANYEQALAFDPTIPAVKLPLARRYEAIGRSSDAARLYEEAAATARAADRGGLLEAAARCRVTAASAAEPDLAAELDRAEAAGDLDAALELAHQLWRAEPGHPAAFRVLANVHRTSGDLAALTELTGVRASRAGTPDERATAWLEVARLAEELGTLDQAARAYDLALIEDPGHISALDARGALAFKLSDFATADLIYRDLGAGESVLGDDELALRRSIIAEQLGRDSESLHQAQVAAQLAPGRRDVLMRVQELATRIGELPTAVSAARAVLELVPLDDDEAQIATQFALVELLREAGQLDEAVHQLEKILRDHPVHAGVIEALAQVHAARGDWTTATRYLYQLVPLAPSPIHRAERLYQLGEVVLVHVNDVDRADDVFLRASDLDPGHIPTLRRLLDVYWRADDPGGIVEVATELADKDALISGPTPDSALAHALVAAALVGDTQLAQRLQAALGDNASRQVAGALAELAGRTGRLQLATASIAIAELARRGLLDLAKLRAATAGTPAANSL
jgi:tetratricopeptide (TPR) repeat protein